MQGPQKWSLHVEQLTALQSLQTTSPHSMHLSLSAQFLQTTSPHSMHLSLSAQFLQTTSPHCVHVATMRFFSSHSWHVLVAHFSEQKQTVLLIAFFSKQGGHIAFLQTKHFHRHTFPLKLPLNATHLALQSSKKQGYSLIPFR